MNKKHIINLSLLAVMLISNAFSAEISLGLSLSTYLTRDANVRQVENGEVHERTTTYNLDMFPSLCIVPSGRFEIVPVFGISLHKIKTVEEDEDGEETNRDESREFGIGGGCGLFARLIEGRAFRLSLGPDVFFWVYNPDDNNYETIEFTLGLPVNVDFLLSERWFLRLNSRLVAVGFTHENEGPDEKTNSFTFFDIESMLGLNLGFYFTF